MDVMACDEACWMETIGYTVENELRYRVQRFGSFIEYIVMCVIMYVWWCLQGDDA